MLLAVNEWSVVTSTDVNVMTQADRLSISWQQQQRSTNAVVSVDAGGQQNSRDDD